MQDVQDAGVSTYHGYTTPGNRFSEKTQNTISKRELVLHDGDSADSVVPPLDAAWTWTSATCACNNFGLVRRTTLVFLQYKPHDIDKPSRFEYVSFAVF
jgi:hypothetical protein